MPKDSQGNEIKYSGFPFITNVDKYVQEELANRSFDRVRAITPFIKVTPGFSPDGSVASKIVLKGIEATAYGKQGEYKFKDLYRPDAFYRPLAGVTKLSVDYKNEYGSIRQATIEWICHTLDDLERLSPFFLNPGYSMFVEWGWSNHVKEVINDDPQVDLGNYFEYGKDKQKLTNGNYDCLMGVVTNYSFAINRDGGFNCSTTVMSSGYLMEGLTVPNQFTIDFYQSKKKKLEKKYKEQGKSDEDAKKLAENDMTGEVHVLDEIYRTLQNFLQEEFYDQIRKDYQKYSSVDESTDYFILTHEPNGMKYLVNDNTGHTVEVKQTETKEVDATGNETTTTKTIEVPIRASVYATWGYLEDEVLNKHIKIKNKKTDNSEGGKMLFSFNSIDSKISAHKFLRTTDLGVCIVPIVNKNDENTPVVPDFRRGKTVESGVDFGYVRRLLINVQFFRDTMLNATTINDGVLQVFSKINDSCINYWNFRMFAVEQQYDDGNKTGGTPLGFAYTPAPFMENIAKNNAIVQQCIVDLNYADKLFEQIGLDSDLYSFRTKAFDISVDGIKKKATSVVRNMSFQSKLSNEAALNVFYSAQNEDGKVMGTPSNNTFQSLYEYDKYNTTITNPTDTFSLGPLRVESPKQGEQESATTPDPGTETESFLKEQYNYGYALLHFLPYKEYGYYVNIEGKQLTGVEGMKIAVLYANKGDAPLATSTALVLLDLEMELEGISGIRIGNVFTIDHIPKIYQKRGVFQVIGITDTIDKNSWITKVKSGFRVFQNVNYEVATRTAEVVTKTNITSIVDSKLIDKDKDPAPKININHVGATAATNTRVYAPRALNLKAYTKESVQNLIDNGTLVQIGDANTNPRFSMSNSASIFGGKMYLERKAAEQFSKWYDEMVVSGVNFTVSSAMRFGVNTGAGPHGYGIAIDFGSLYGKVFGSTNPQANLAARINTPEYSQIAEIGKKYGWYNPWRLSNQSGQEELWHFEYWGEA